jgi:fatty acid desaturase
MNREGRAAGKANTSFPSALTVIALGQGIQQCRMIAKSRHTLLAEPHQSSNISFPVPSLSRSPSPSPAHPSYARVLRPHLPAKAFTPDPTALLLVGINIAILVLGWRMADRLDRWPIPWLAAWLPFAVVMGNSVFVLGLLAHDLLHGSLLRGRGWRRVLGVLAFGMEWMTPTLWQAVHNREHHGHTNGLDDPDRGYLEGQPRTWGKMLFEVITQSSDVHPVMLALGMTSAWPMHHFRTAVSLLFFPEGKADLTPTSFGVSPREKRWIVAEMALVLAMHGAVLFWLDFQPLKLLMGYFLPLWIGYAMGIAYIYTHHLASPLSADNDALLTTLSLRMPAWVDCLHLNFSYHAEHHVFPGMNSNY